jgi:hypothetical protein
VPYCTLCKMQAVTSPHYRNFLHCREHFCPKGVLAPSVPSGSGFRFADRLHARTALFGLRRSQWLATLQTRRPRTRKASRLFPLVRPLSVILFRYLSAHVSPFKICTVIDFNPAEPGLASMNSSNEGAPAQRETPARSGSKPTRTRKAYQKPTFRYERVFETMALSCGKLSPTEFQCHFHTKTS